MYFRGYEIAPLIEIFCYYFLNFPDKATKNVKNRYKPNFLYCIIIKIQMFLPQ